MAKRRIQIEDTPQYMQMGGSPADNTRYSGNRYYDQTPRLPPGSHIDTNYRPDDWGNKEYGQRVSYPGDTLTSNQLQDYKDRTYQLLYPDYNQVVQQRGSRPQDRSYYMMSEKDQQKLHDMKRDGPNFMQFLLGKGKQVGQGELPTPKHQYGGNAAKWHHQYGGQADSDGDIDIMKDGGNWIKGAVNPAHKGYCTPMTKSTCTGRRRAFAETMKKHHGFHEQGGPVYQQGGYYDFSGAFDDVLSAGLAAGNYFAGQNNARDVHRSAQNQGLSDNMMHMNQPGGHGDYDQSGIFRPDQYTPTRAGNFYPTQKYGGYQHGGVYDMDEKTIQKLRKQGYQLEYI